MTAPLTYTLTAVDELLVETSVPLDRVEAVELFGTVHTFDDHLHGLHDDLAECLGPIDNRGRCLDCGRLVARVHKERGCMMAIPLLGTALWLFDHVESVPFFGKQLWLWKRRRTLAARSSTAGVADVRPTSAPAVGHLSAVGSVPACPPTGSTAGPATSGPTAAGPEAGSPSTSSAHPPTGEVDR